MSPTNENQPTFQKEQFTAAEYLKFIVPSVIAFTIFLGPVKINGSFTTIMAWMLDFNRAVPALFLRLIRPFSAMFCSRHDALAPRAARPLLGALPFIRGPSKHCETRCVH
jgi:hypothetical protein